MNTSNFLETQRVPFDVLPHPRTFSAQRLAHALDVPGDNVAKSVVLKVDDEYVLAVLKAPDEIDIHKIETALAANRVVLASEDELADLFPDCELGAVPPFGSQYGLRTIVDEALKDDEHIVFDGNTHAEAIYMRFFDYEKIEKPAVLNFSTRV